MVDQVPDVEYPAYWEADVVLRDGGTAHLRPIAPADADAVQAFHQGQSETSIYLRFFTYKSKLSAKELKRFTEVDHRDRVAFVITVGGAIIGIGRYDRLADPAEAEVAFNVSDHHQSRGVGSILLEHLAAAARENGIRRFSAEVLPENRKMLTVFAEAGYEVSRHFDDGVVMLEFSIDPTERSRAVMEAREHRAEARSVAELLTPSSVAVIGASRDWGSIGHSLLHNIVEGGFPGPVYGINPQAFELGGAISYAHIAEVPGPVQLAVIAVPYEEVPGVVRECAAAGVRGVLIATSGFADDGDRGLARQRALVRQARAYGMRVIGPASLGIINTAPAVSLNASVAPELPRRGNLGLFSQSAAIGVMLYAAMSRRGLGMSSFISAGHRADVSGNDAMQYLEDDPATRAVGMYLESFGNPRKFSRIARRLSRSKPVIVAKSELMGLRLPPGHEVRTTQAPAGALDAMLRQSGVIRVETNEQLMDIAQLVTSQPLPAGGGTAVISNSRALGRVVADSCETQGLSAVVQSTSLDLDAGRSVALPALRRALGEALADPQVHAAVVALLPARGLGPGPIAELVRECAAAAGKPVVASFTGILDPAVRLEGLLATGEDAGRQDSGEPGRQEPAAPAAPGVRGKPAVPGTPEGTNRDEAGSVAGPLPGLPCYTSPGAAVAALAAVVRYAQWRRRDFGESMLPAGLRQDDAETLIEGWMEAVPGTELHRLGRADTARLLACYGIEVLAAEPFETVEEAVDAADRLGWPVALKTTDEYLRHRLDLGGVRLNIVDRESLTRNIAQMRQVLRPYGAFGLEVQAMAPTGQGCIVRAIEDPLLGPVVSFGLAGDAVELLGDWSHRIPPLTTTDVMDLIRGPRAAEKLFGYQGLPAGDVSALADTIARVAALKDNHPEVALIEFTPLLVSATGATVLGADIRLGNHARRTDSARRAMRD